MRPRMLFPTSNQTTNCHNICDSTCPYGCYPYPNINFYIPPPPPTIESNNKVVQNILPYIIISIALFVSLFLLLTYYIIIVRNCSNWNRRRTRGEGDNDESIIHHPIWYIDTIGIEVSFVNLITIFKYKTGDGLVDGTECAVCLNEFQDDESLKLLPKCNHAFHIDCIDTWLRSHVNCPLCRAPIISNTVAAPVGSSIIAPISSTNDDIGSIVETNNNNEAREVEFQENTNVENDDNDDDDETSKKEDEILQKMRRSVSMGSSIATKKCVETKTNEGTSSNSRIQRVMDSASSMKRSFSYGGRSFFPKSKRNEALI